MGRLGWLGRGECYSPIRNVNIVDRIEVQWIVRVASVQWIYMLVGITHCCGGVSEQ